MRYCGYCGVELALAAVYLELKVNEQGRVDLPMQISPDTISEGLPLTPEVLVPRLGDYLVVQGVLPLFELEKALQYQRERSLAGFPILLGQALRELNLVDAASLDQAITVQILQLQDALRESNRRLEQRVLERTVELRRAIDQLTELSQLKANFVANISHELRTPLTHIKGYLDILAESGLGPLTPQQEQALAVLQRSEARLERLIEDLIQFSLASRGELSITFTEVDLETLINQSVVQLMYKVREASLDVNLRVERDLPRVKCDEKKIQWVITQLFDNAIKFTSKGGRIGIEAFQLDGMVTVRVTDTGIGIPSDRLEEIFEPFHQLDGSATRRYSGTGLGLALSNRILEAHGSRVMARSVVGEGSSFGFSLPMSASNGEERKPHHV
jgi:signal transduction histidine kinase